jgi:ABC-type phosphate/phosphonate transport system ATPase subunit
MTKIKTTGLFLGITGFCIPLLFNFPGLSLAGHLAMSIFLMAAVFWMFETIPIYSTSILVIFSQVLLLSTEGIIDYSGIAGYDPLPYTRFIGTLANPIIILFLGGFVLADASVKYDFDKNLTRILLSPFGNRTSTIILGLMAVTAALSAFMSNTATTAMMITVIIPIIAKMDPADPARIGIALSVPFAANIGGIATPIGTPPNAVVIAALKAVFLPAEEILQLKPASLSGGMRKRVGIARALYHDADLIVFDEATSALDNLTERDVMAAIDALPGDKTVLMIAHRLSTVRRCDRIIVLDQGRLVGIGPWDTLIKENEAFQRIANISEVA